MIIDMPSDNVDKNTAQCSIDNYIVERSMSKVSEAGEQAHLL